MKNCRELKVLELAPLGQWEMPGAFFELRLENPGWEGWTPGQFVMIRPMHWDLDMLWGRPFSISSLDEDGLTLFIQAVGRGTRRLRELDPGQKVTVWGPLGNGFAVDSKARTLLLAGGVGLAPFRAYVELHPEPARLELFFAHRPALHCYPYAWFSGRIAAQAMREQRPGDLDSIIAALRERIAAQAPDGLVLACGPTPFLRTVRAAALASKVRCQVSLENRMACGVGACLGCVVQNAEGHNVQTCTCGPVFFADEIEL